MSMCPYLIKQGGLTLSSYAFFYGLGLAAAGLVMSVLLRKRGLSYRRSSQLFLLLAVAVVIGGWGLYVMVRWIEVREGSLFDVVSGGQMLHGSLLLIVLLLGLFARLLRVGVQQAFDAVAVSAALGLAIGRVGCVLGGCCHGRTTDMPWAVTYPKVINVEGGIVGSPAYMLHLHRGLIPVAAGASLPVHPVQLYESILMIVLFAVLLALWRRGRLVGRLAPLFIVGYSLVRFNLEFIRVQGSVIWGLTLAQTLSVGIGATAAMWFILGRKANLRRGPEEGELPASTDS